MKRMAFFLLVSLTTIAFCGPENYVEENVKWSTKSIQVCFASRDEIYKLTLQNYLYELKTHTGQFEKFNSKEKQVIKEIISSEFRTNRTGIEFTGWKDCHDLTNSNVYLFKTRIPKADFKGLSTMGDSGEMEVQTLSHPQTVFYKDPKKPISIVTLNAGLIKGMNLSYLDDLKLIALHEFGHLSGLRHEHIDPISKQFYSMDKHTGDANCDLTSMTSDEKITLGDSTKKFGVYDPNSIMNYCFNYLLEIRGLEILASKDQGINPVIIDSTLYKASTVTYKETDVTVTTYNMRIGLSQGDIHALKCLYVYDKKTYKKVCHPNYNPRLNSP